MFGSDNNPKERQMDDETALKAKKHRKAKKAAKKCHVEKVKGGRLMLICPHKRPRFISEGQARAYRRR